MDTAGAIFKQEAVESEGFREPTSSPSPPVQSLPVTPDKPKSDSHYFYLSDIKNVQILLKGQTFLVTFTVVCLLPADRVLLSRPLFALFDFRIDYLFSRGFFFLERCVVLHFICQSFRCIFLPLLQICQSI